MLRAFLRSTKTIKIELRFTFPVQVGRERRRLFAFRSNYADGLVNFRFSASEVQTQVYCDACANKTLRPEHPDHFTKGTSKVGTIVMLQLDPTRNTHWFSISYVHHLEEAWMERCVSLARGRYAPPPCSPPMASLWWGFLYKADPCRLVSETPVTRFSNHFSVLAHSVLMKTFSPSARNEQRTNKWAQLT